MRLATPIEILAHFGTKELMRICNVGPNAVGMWGQKKRIPAKRLIQIALAHPRKLVTDDEGYVYWLEESEYTPPDWVPFHWWMTYLHMRQRENLGVDEDQLAEVVAKLDKIRMAGGDVALALRYASTRKLRIPVDAERK